MSRGVGGRARSRLGDAVGLVARGRLQGGAGRVGGRAGSRASPCPLCPPGPPSTLAADPVALAAALVGVASVSGDEGALADAVEAALRELPQFEVVRCGDAVLARTHLGRERRVLLAGHLEHPVPIADNLPSRRDGTLLHGCQHRERHEGG